MAGSNPRDEGLQPEGWITDQIRTMALVLRVPCRTLGFEPATTWLVRPTRPTHGPFIGPIEVTIEEALPEDAWALTCCKTDTGAT